MITPAHTLLLLRFGHETIGPTNDVPCTYRISIKAVIKDEQGRVLLLQERGGSWELPGGCLDHGEVPREALVREISEETGL